MSRHSQHREGAGRRRDPATTRRGIGGGGLRLEGARPFVARRAGGGGGIFQTRDASAEGGGGVGGAGGRRRPPHLAAAPLQPGALPGRGAGAAGRTGSLGFRFGPPAFERPLVSRAAS